MGLVLIHHCSANISAGWVVGARLWDGGTLVPTKEDTVGDLTSMSRGQDFCNKWEPRGRNGADGGRYSPSSHEDPYRKCQEWVWWSFCHYPQRSHQSSAGEMWWRQSP